MFFCVKIHAPFCPMKASCIPYSCVVFKAAFTTDYLFSREFGTQNCLSWAFDEHRHSFEGDTINLNGKKRWTFFLLEGTRPRVGRRHSMENMELMKLTPEKVGAFLFKKKKNSAGEIAMKSKGFYRSLMLEMIQNRMQKVIQNRTPKL